MPYLFCRLPLGQLPQPLLTSPHTGVNDLQEQLPSSRVQDEDGSVDRLGGQITLKGLVDCDTVHIGVVHKPDYLVAEELPIVLAAEVGFGRF